MNSVQIQAPKHPATGSNVNATFKGTTAGNVKKFLASFIDAHACANTGLGEARHAGVQERDFLNLKQHFHRTTTVFNVAGKRYICVYLQSLNRAAGYPTLAHASFRYSTK